MFRKNEFKAALARNNMTIEDIAKALNVTSPTVFRKLNGTSDFFRSEIDAISKLLHLSSEEILKIFFA